MAEHRGRLVHEQVAQRCNVACTLGAHDALVVEQAAGLERLEVAQAIGRERAVDLVARVEHPALGVTKRPGLEAGAR